MENVFYFAWEPALMAWLQAHLGPVGIAVASFFSTLGEEMVFILLMGFLYWCYDKEIGKFLGRNICVANVANPLLKNIVLRPRPYMVCPEVQCLKPVDPSADVMDIAAQGYSFPSGHSSGSVTAYGSVGRRFKQPWIRVLSVLIPLFVGISRFCVGVHFPTDVLTGWILGLIVIFVTPWFIGRFKNRWIPYVILLVAALPGWFYCRTNDYFTAYGMMVGFFAADLFEEKYVRFQNTRVLWKMALRLLGGVAIYFGLNTLLKLPFSSAFLDSGTFAAHLVRALRYAIILFVDVAIYPLAFDRLGQKKKQP